MQTWRWRYDAELRRIPSGAVTPGTLVKPIKGPKTWRLGVVESIDGDRIKVRAYVAPAGAYEGSAATFARDELAEVPRAEVEGALQVVRARIANEQQLERQIVAALEASETERRIEPPLDQ